MWVCAVFCVEKRLKNVILGERGKKYGADEGFKHVRENDCVVNHMLL